MVSRANATIRVVVHDRMAKHCCRSDVPRGQLHSLARRTLPSGLCTSTLAEQPLRLRAYPAHPRNQRDLHETIDLYSDDCDGCSVHRLAASRWMPWRSSTACLLSRNRHIVH